MLSRWFEKGTMRTRAAAETFNATYPTKQNERVRRKMAKLDKAENMEAAKIRAEEIAQESTYTIQQRETSKHTTRVKNKNKDPPIFNLKFKKVHATCEGAPKDCVARLLTLAADKIREKQNLRGGGGS